MKAQCRNGNEVVDQALLGGAAVERKAKGEFVQREERMIGSRLDQVVATRPEADALIFEGRAYTWSDLAHVVTTLEGRIGSRAQLQDLPIGVLAYNCPATVAALVTILRNHGCFVSINPLQGVKRIVDDVVGLQLSHVIMPASQQDTELSGALTHAGVQVVLIDEDSDLAVLDIDQVESPPLAQSSGTGSVIAADTAILMQSSGTTGVPKKIPLSYDSFLHPFADSLQQPLDSGEAPKSPLVITSPMSHIAGLFHSVRAVLDGRAQILMRKFEVETWASTIEEHQLKLGHLVPATLAMIMDAEIAPERLASLRAVICGTAQLKPELQRAFEQRYGVPVLVVYGATEFAGGVAGWDIGLHAQFMPEKLGSVGRAFSGTQLQVVSESTGESLPCGGEGILEIKSVQAIGSADTWVRTTDIARLDDDDFLWICGRADTVINRGGFKILPSEVESLLGEHPGVSESAVVGIPDTRLGEVPAAAVVVRDASVSEQDLQALCKKKMLRYQVPAVFRIVDALPRTASMKPDLPAVKELFREQ